MPQPIAPSTIRKQIPAAITPTGLPPTIWSESAVAGALPPPRRASARRPTANSAGRPAPARRASTTICHRAVQLIHGGMGVGGAAMSSSPSLSDQAQVRLGTQAAAGSASAGSLGATEPFHSEFTLSWPTLVLRDRIQMYPAT